MIARPPQPAPIAVLEASKLSVRTPKAAFRTVRAMSPHQLLLSLFCAIAPIFVQGTEANQFAITMAWIQAGTALMLTIMTGREVLRGAVPGKFLLCSSVLVFFSSEAATSAAAGFPSSYLAHASEFRLENIQLALIYIGLFQLMLLIGYEAPIRIPRAAQKFLSRLDAGGFRLNVQFVLAALAFVPLLLTVGTAPSAWVVSLLASRNQNSTAPSDIGLLAHVAHVGLAGATLLAVRSLTSRGMRSVVFAVAGLICLTPHLSRGTRHLTLYALIPAFLCLISLRRRWQLFAIIVIAVLFLQIQYLVRYQGWDRVDYGIVASSATTTNVTGQFDALVLAVALVPSVHEYFHEPVTPLFVTHNIPRQWWRGKPASVAWEYYNGTYSPSKLSNVTPSVIGQYHMNWGWPGVLLIGLWFGLLAKVLDVALITLHIRTQLSLVVVLGMFYAALVCSFRYYHPLYFVYPEACLLVVLIVTRAQRRAKTPSPGA